jgi:hypothetical protein
MNAYSFHFLLPQSTIAALNVAITHALELRPQAVLLYQLTLWHQAIAERNLRQGLKPLLRSA